VEDLLACPKYGLKFWDQKRPPDRSESFKESSIIRNEILRDTTYIDFRRLDENTSTDTLVHL
jgi:hypothetical protein